MSSWKNITIDDHRHPLSQRVFEITQAVYRAYDPQNTPGSLDFWWHSQSIGYQLDDSEAEPSIIILNLREGQPDFPAMDTRFTVNFKTRKVIDKVNDTRVPIPQEALSSVDEIDSYVRREIKTEKEAREEAAERARRASLERKRKAEAEHEAQIADFLDRFSSHGLSVPPEDLEYYGSVHPKDLERSS